MSFSSPQGLSSLRGTILGSTRGTLLGTLLGTIVLCLCMSEQATAAKRVIHQEKSLYQNILVTEHLQQRCLTFSGKSGNKRQTCINTRHAKRIVFQYVKMSLAGLLLNPNPKRMLMIGLGGGTLSGLLAALFPELHIDIVELDPAVLRVARDYFNFKETSRIRVHIQDGRVFVRRYRLQHQPEAPRYDLIILDAFTGDYIPAHLMTQEFLQDIKALVAPQGVVLANTFSTSGLYDHESVTYQTVFGDFFNFKMPGSNNRVILATTQGLPHAETLAQHAQLLAPRLADYGVKVVRFPKYLGRHRDWDQSVRPLTDQFAPVNQLQGSSTRSQKINKKAE